MVDEKEPDLSEEKKDVSTLHACVVLCMAAWHYLQQSRNGVKRGVYHVEAQEKE